jgi:hypothetical protein
MNMRGGKAAPTVTSGRETNLRGGRRNNDQQSGNGGGDADFKLDLDKVIQGRDNRTTLMIRNIPNKCAMLSHPSYFRDITCLCCCPVKHMLRFY